jgi:hypothetical protein
VLSDWLVETVDALYKQGGTTLTIDALNSHRESEQCWGFMSGGAAATHGLLECALVIFCVLCFG